MQDIVAKKTRGLIAIAISDAIEAEGLRPVSKVLVTLRSFFRIELPSSALDLADHVLAARRTSMTIGCVGLFGVVVVPLLLPLEIARGMRVRKRNRLARARLEGTAPPPADGYREHAAPAAELRAALAGADAAFAIDWSIWRDGSVCFAGAALGVVHGDRRDVPWFVVYRGAPPRDALDAGAIVRALPDAELVRTRWAWELDDPFEATERA